MDDATFVAFLSRYAQELKGEPLTAAEMKELVDAFNSEQGSAGERAQAAAEKVIRRRRQDELRKSANIDNTLRLLQDLQQAAKQWQAAKK